MSHTNHRQGTRENLSNCFVTIAMASQGINTAGASQKLQQFLDIAARHNPVNAGNMKVGNLYVAGSMEKLSAGMEGSIVQAAFNSEDDLVGFLTDLNEADLGVSVVVTGLMDETKKCSEKAGLHRHTVEYSLGVFGKTERLPDKSIMEISTMCGHGQVSFNLVQRMVKDVTRGVLTLDEATMTLTKPCICGIVDPTRVRRLLEKMVAASIKPALHNYIAMDPSKCDKCYACEVACVEAHPNNSSQPMCIVDGPGHLPSLPPLCQRPLHESLPHGQHPPRSGEGRHLHARRPLHRLQAVRQRVPLRHDRLGREGGPGAQVRPLHRSAEGGRGTSLRCRLPNRRAQFSGQRRAVEEAADARPADHPGGDPLGTRNVGIHPTRALPCHRAMAAAMALSILH